MSTKSPPGRESTSTASGSGAGSGSAATSEAKAQPDAPRAPLSRAPSSFRNTLSSVAGLGSILVKLRRWENKSGGVDGLPASSDEPARDETATKDAKGGRRKSLASSPKKKAHHIISNSGDTPLTHPVLLGQSLRKPAFLTPTSSPRPSVERGRRTTPRGSSEGLPALFAENGGAETSASPSRPGPEPDKAPAHVPSAAETVARAKTLREARERQRASIEFPAIGASRSASVSERRGSRDRTTLGGDGEPMLKKRGRMSRTDVYRTADAVDTSKLLRATRNSILEKAAPLGANALADEQWSCTICGPKHRSDGTFRVTVSYTATAARSKVADPGIPVALERAKGVPGLMTIVDRKSA